MTTFEWLCYLIMCWLTMACAGAIGWALWGDSTVLAVGLSGGAITAIYLGARTVLGLDR